MSIIYAHVNNMHELVGNQPPLGFTALAHGHSVVEHDQLDPQEAALALVTNPAPQEARTPADHPWGDQLKKELPKAQIHAFEPRFHVICDNPLRRVAKATIRIVNT